MYDSNLVGRYERKNLKILVKEPAWIGSQGQKYLGRTDIPGGFFFKEAGKNLDQAILYERTKFENLPPEFVKKIVEVGAFQFFRPSIFWDLYKDRKQIPNLEIFHVLSRSILTLDQLSENDLLCLVDELEKKPEKKRHNPEITEEDKVQFQG
ncbi:hypothetical protein HY837_04435 [archaeon]|nr:hypothetical protein [archaeon]